ncbi:hypothetical protein [Pseudomonas sp.]|uniref:hypothetical protein n=1 Tax=Pseudomonas sp. TaxID=306 RepID=UPI00260749EC|nr:hypothetical protein [Pseudomonas sp.]
MTFTGSPAIDAVSDAQKRTTAAQHALADALAGRNAAIVAAVESGESPLAVALAAGVSVQTVSRAVKVATEGDAK